MNPELLTERLTPAERTTADAGAVLVVDKVSKRYDIYERPEDRLKQSVMPRLEKLLPARLRRGKPYFHEFWALRDVSLALRPGEVLGILGRNGAGKSTLLQIIAGTLTPTAGTAVTRGKVAALLELGSGFSSEFTGRENVRMNASLLGLTSDEIDDRFGEITAFADIGDFIDQPVKTYSSGMMLRLAFAVQTAVNPEILIVDEALAVGDARFQKKCFNRLEQLQRTGTTILLVTHDSGTIVQFCSRAMILDRGQVFASGQPQEITREYHKLLFDDPDKTNEKPANAVAGVTVGVLGAEQITQGSSAKPTGNREIRYGTGEAQIISVGLRDAKGADTNVIETLNSCEFYFRIAFRSSVKKPVAYGFIISNARGVEVYGTKSGLFSTSIECNEANSAYECRLRFVVRLVPGRYFLSVALAHADDRAEGQFLDYRFDVLEFEVIGPLRTFSTSLVDLDADLSHVCLSGDSLLQPNG